MGWRGTRKYGVPFLERFPRAPHPKRYVYRAMEPIEAFALYKLGKINSDRIISFANDCLEKDLYTESIGELSMMTNPIMSDVGPLFEKAMQELKINEPTKIEAANTIIHITLKRIVANEIGPDEGASFLYWDVHHELIDVIPDKKYVGDSLGLEYLFLWLREIWDCKDGSMILYHTNLSRAEAEVKFKEHLVEEAEKLLKKRHNKAN
jgi:hypothetical protein